MRVEPVSEPLDLTGRWRVVHHVESSERVDFVGLNIEFQIDFLQDGQQLAGEGEKFLVDRQPANPDEISRLAITGWISGDEVRISLMEVTPNGPAQTIIGEIVWNAAGPAHMIGNFRVDVANTRGRSEAVRQAVSPVVD